MVPLAWYGWSFYGLGCVPKIVLGSKITQWQQLLLAARRLPFAKAPIAQAFDRNQHNLWDTTKAYAASAAPLRGSAS
jgi:hypothetical protein